MYEFDSVRVSTYEAASLAAKLTEKSADGWDVVAIVPAGSDITAFLKRSSSGSDGGGTADATTVMSSSAAGESASVNEPEASEVSEPSGWGTAPAAAAGATSWGQTSGSDSGSSWGSGAATTPAESSGGWGSSASTPAASAPTAPSTPATPSVPAGWYHDPAGRFELRYWDGSAWTEHVSRNGQQYTDPPVA